MSASRDRDWGIAAQVAGGLALVVIQALVFRHAEVLGELPPLHVATSLLLAAALGAALGYASASITHGAWRAGRLLSRSRRASTAIVFALLYLALFGWAVATRPHELAEPLYRLGPVSRVVAVVLTDALRGARLSWVLFGFLFLVVFWGAPRRQSIRRIAFAAGELAGVCVLLLAGQSRVPTVVDAPVAPTASRTVVVAIEGSGVGGGESADLEAIEALLGHSRRFVTISDPIGAGDDPLAFAAPSPFRVVDARRPVPVRGMPADAPARWRLLWPIVPLLAHAPVRAVLGAFAGQLEANGPSAADVLSALDADPDRPVIIRMSTRLGDWPSDRAAHAIAPRERALGRYGGSGARRTWMLEENRRRTLEEASRRIVLGVRARRADVRWVWLRTHAPIGQAAEDERAHASESPALVQMVATISGAVGSRDPNAHPTLLSRASAQALLAGDAPAPEPPPGGRFACLSRWRAGDRLTVYITDGTTTMRVDRVAGKIMVRRARPPFAEVSRHEGEGLAVGAHLSRLFLAGLEACDLPIAERQALGLGAAAPARTSVARAGQ